MLVKRLILLLFCTALVAAPPALAKRGPTASESKAIRAAMTAFISAKNSPAAKDNVVTRIFVSTIDPTYALVHTKSPTVGIAFALLHKVKGIWTVKGFGTGGFECGTDGPKKVLTELFGGCIPK